MFYAVIKRYESDKTEFCDWHFKTDEHDEIYDKVMELNGNNHTEAADIASWCENAAEGWIYEFDNGNGEVEIQDIE